VRMFFLICCFATATPILMELNKMSEVSEVIKVYGAD
jgi:hypothetical protein